MITRECPVHGPLAVETPQARRAFGTPDGFCPLLKADEEQCMQQLGPPVEWVRATEADSIEDLRARFQAQHLPCPTPGCGLLPIAEHVGIVMVTWTKGHRDWRREPAPDAPHRLECPQGHFWVEVDGKATVTGPPEEVEVVHEPRSSDG